MASKKSLKRDLVLMRTERDQALERLGNAQKAGRALETDRDEALRLLEQEKAGRARDASTWESQRQEGEAQNRRLLADRDAHRAEAQQARTAATMERNTLRDTIGVLTAERDEAVRESQARGARITELADERDVAQNAQRLLVQDVERLEDERDEARSERAQYAEAADRLIRESRPKTEQLDQARSDLADAELSLTHVAEALGIAPREAAPGPDLITLVLSAITELREQFTPYVNVGEHARALARCRELEGHLATANLAADAATAEKAMEVEKKNAARREADELLSQADVLRSEVAELTEALATCEPGVMRTAPSHVVRMATRQEPDDANQAVIWEPADPFASLTRSIYDPNTLGALSLHARVLASMGFHVRCTVTRAADVTVDAPEAHTVFRDASEDVDHAAQVDKLAEFIMDEVPGEPSRSEGAVDTAIRLITGMMGYLEDANPAELASIGITPGWRGRPKALEPLTVVNRETPEVVLLGINTHAHIDMLRPALQQLSRELDRPVLISAFANGSTVSIPRVTMETLNPVVTRIEAPGDEAPDLIEQMLAETRTELKLPPVKGQSIPFFSSPADGRMTNHGTDVPPAPPSPHPAGLTTITALDADGTPSGPSLVVHDCKAEPGDEKHCRGNSGRHHPHDWWDDHEFDPTRWHCDGSTTYELREGQCGWDVLGFACTLDAGHAPDGTGGHQSTGITSVVPRDSAPVGPPAFICEADVYAPPSSEDLDDEGWIAQTTYDEPNEWQREKIAELADLLPEVDEELAETGAPELAEPTSEDSEGHIVRLAEPEGQVRRYAARDESQHDPAKVTDASEVSAALADVEAEAIATVEANAEDEAIADGFPSGAIVRDWLDGNRERIQQALTPHVSGLVTEATDDLIDALAPPTDAPAS